MKKYFMAVAIFVAVMTACGGGSTETKAPVSVQTGEAAKTDETKAAEQKAEETAAAETEAAKPAADESIEEQIIMDQDGIKVTAKSLDKSGMFGPAVKVLIENESGKDVTVQARNASVNGYMTETMFSAEVQNGKKANEELIFMNSGLKKAGIDTIADMEFNLHVFDPSTYQNIFDSDVITLKTPAAETYEYTFDDSGEVAYEGNGIKVVIKGLDEEGVMGPGIVTYIENSGDKGITVQTRDVSINGFMVDPIFSADVLPGKHAISTITFMTSELEKNDIKEIQDVELSFHLFESANIMNNIADSDPVKISF